MSFKFFRKHQKKMLWVVVIVTIFTFSIFSVTSAMRACFGRPTGGYGEFTLLDGTVMPITLERQLEVKEFLNNIMRDRFTQDEVIKHIVLYEEAQHAGIRISDEEFQESIDSIFGRTLTPEAYRNFVRNFGFSSPREFEKAWREFITVNKLQVFYNQAEDCILTEDVYEEFKLQNEEFKVDYVAYNVENYADKLKAEDIEEEDLEEYYGQLRVGSAKEDYLIPEQFSFDVAYVDLEKVDFEDFAELTADITIEKDEAKWYYYQTEQRFVIEDEESTPDGDQESGDTGTEDPAGQDVEAQDDEYRNIKKHVPFEEVEEQCANELKVIKLIDRALEDWVEFSLDNELTPKVGEPPVKEEEPEEGAPEEGEDKPDPDAFFKELCKKYNLTYERIEGPVSWAALDTLEPFGSEEFKVRAKMLRPNQALVVKPGDASNTKLFPLLARVTKRVEPELKSLDEIRDILLEDYMRKEKMDLARQDAEGLINAMVAKLEELEDIKPRVEKIRESSTKKAEDEIASMTLEGSFTEEKAQQIRDRYDRSVLVQIQNELRPERHRVFDEVCAESGLQTATIDYYSKTVSRDREALKEEGDAEYFIKGRMSFRITRMNENEISDPMRDEENGAYYIVRILDRQFPPPERMTAEDIDSGRKTLESNRMMARYQAQRAAQESGTPDASDPFSVQNIKQKYQVRFSRPAEPEQPGGEGEGGQDG